MLVSISSRLSDSKALLLCCSCIDVLQYRFEYEKLDVQVAFILVIWPVPSVRVYLIWTKFLDSNPSKVKKREGEIPLVIGKRGTFHCNP